jgi:hypothetical protein
MREAFGGTFMIYIMMIFVVLFVSFTAVLVNVAKTFRIKNEIINIIEQDGGFGNGSNAETDIEAYFDTTSYQIITDREDLSKSCASSDGFWEAPGYCVVPIPSKDKPSYYKVTTYVSISLPIFELTFTIPISGETKSYQDLK